MADNGDDEEIQFDFMRTKTRVKALETQFTRNIKRIQNLLDRNKATSTAHTIETLEKEAKGLQDLLQDLNNTYLDLQVADPQNFETHSKALEVLNDHYDTINEHILLALEAAKKAEQAKPEANHAVATADGAGTAHQPINTALEPTKLCTDSSLGDLRAWIRRYNAYLESGGYTHQALSVQHELFRSFLSDELANRIDPHIQATTPIQGQNGCIALLEQEFMKIYPIFSRRLEIFRTKQPQNVDFTTFAKEHLQRAHDAELNTMKVDELHAFILMCNCTDAKLQAKFFKLATPTVKALEKEALSYEAANKYINDVNKQGTSSTLARVNYKFKGRSRSQSDRRGPQKFFNQKQTPSRQSSSRKDKLQQFHKCCLRCGSKGHTTNCPRRHTLVCHTCQTPGHSSTVCLGGPNKDRTKSNTRPSSRSSSRSRPPSRSQSHSPTRSRSPSPQTNRTHRVVNRIGGASKDTPRMKDMQIKAKGADDDTRFKFDSFPDTGASRSVMGLDLAEKHEVPIKPAPHDALEAANGACMDVTGQVHFHVKFQHHTAVLDCLISKDIKDDFLVSWQDLQQLCVLPENFPAVLSDVPHSLSLINAITDKKTTDSKEKVLADYPTVLSDSLGTSTIIGEPMKIYLHQNMEIIPYNVATPRRIPANWNDKADDVVTKMLNDQVIERVEGPSLWCSPAKFVEKDDGTLRFVVDFTRLNEYIQRPTHPFQSARQIMDAILPNSKWFAKLDALSGYHQCLLHEDSRHLTTFILPSGRYRFLRAPQGLSSSGDEFCLRSDRAIEGLPWAHKLVDDILIEADTESDLFQRIRTLLDKMKEHKIICSKKKFQIGTTIPFAGYIVSADGIKPDPERTKAIQDFPTPRNVSDVRSFLGLANQLGHFVPDLAHATNHLRTLLHKGNEFTWQPEHQADFEKVKEILTSPLLLQPFDKNLPTQLLTDAAKTLGLGFVLIQRTPDDKIRLISCGSRSLTDAEKRYAVIELECLAIAWAISKSDYNLRGSSFQVFTDHKPLLGVFNKAFVDVPNARLQRLREKLVDYDFELTYTAGKTHLAADALSRAPVSKPEKSDVAIISTVLNSTISNDPALKSLSDVANDPEYAALRTALKNDINPKNLSHDHPAKAFANVWSQLSLLDNSEKSLIILDDHRIVIPKPARKLILRLLHVPHAGLSKTRTAASKLYYWPGMNSDLKNAIESCDACTTHLPSQAKEPLIPTTADSPMSQVACDLFDYAGHNWLVMVDRYSGFPFAQRLNKTTTSDITKLLTKWFQDFGFPQVIRSDGGPQFRSEFESYCKSHNIVHELSSPYNPRSNGLAESAVKNVKTLLKKCLAEKQDFATALTEFRNFERQDGFSPAEMMFGRRQRTTLPTLPPKLIDRKAAESARDSTRQRTNAHHDKTAQTLPPLVIDQPVHVQDPRNKRWDAKGIVIAIRESGRSYLIDVNGRHFIRNRRFLRPIKQSPTLPDPPVSNSPIPSPPPRPPSPPPAPAPPRRSPRLAQKRGIRFQF